MHRSAGETFQKATRHRPGEAWPAPPRWLRRRPDWVKRYRGAPRIDLPRPRGRGGTSLWDLIRARRSQRDHGTRALRPQELSQLLWAAAGLTSGQGKDGLRAAPSAGGVNSIETYVVAHHVRGLAPGVYHYAVEDHALETVRTVDLRETLEAICLEQEQAGQASVVFVFTAVFGRAAWEYGPRAYRYVYLDAGHSAQNLALAAEALGLGACPLGAFQDAQLDEILGVDGRDESAIYLMSVGPRPTGGEA